MGLAELAKMTWVLLFLAWPLLWALSVAVGHKNRIALTQSLLQLLLVVVLGLYVLNLGYAFDGTLTRLDDYEFVSRSLAGSKSLVDGGVGGNRFTGTPFARLPVPLPKDYLAGMDIQKADFERKMPAYLGGRSQLGGWWYYYLFSAILKVPLGIWTMGVLAFTLTLLSVAPHSQCLPQCRAYFAGYLAEASLLLPFVLVFVFVSSQTGICRFFRYVLPALPFVFIWVSKCGLSISLNHHLTSRLSVAAMCWFATSSLMIYPHSMSYFNELTGGPIGGHAYLADANIDWQQDMWYLRAWHDSHPTARPLYVDHHGILNPALFGIDSCRITDLEKNISRDSHARTSDAHTSLDSMYQWYAISIHNIRTTSGRNWSSLLAVRPVAMAGYSTYIYRLSVSQADSMLLRHHLAEFDEKIPLEQSNHHHRRANDNGFEVAHR